MNWIQSLYETYENCQNMIGDVEDEDHVPLLPICHTTQKAQIEITLDSIGNFRRARVVGKDEARTIIPCTEKSAGRTSGEAAHPLCDKLQYLAADYKKYGGEKNHYFKSYLELLFDWVKKGAPAKVSAIYDYVQKGNVIGDLVTNRVLFANEQEEKLYNQRPFEKEENAEIDIFDLLPGRIDPKTGKLESWQADAFVRWKVEGDSKSAEVWKDREIIQAWIHYYSETKQTKSFCYVTGEESISADQHPAKIRNDADKAKLIASGKSISGKGKITIDDACGFTFLGRFTHPDQVATVGFEISQKAHFALRWLMSRQGYVKGELGVVAWAVSGAKLIQPTDDPIDALDKDVPAEESKNADTAQEVGIRLRNKIAGYRREIGEHEKVVVMAVDSVTSKRGRLLGRLSIVYYRALKGSEFLKRIESWHETCAWRHAYHLVKRQDKKGKIKKHSIPFYGAPAPADIAEAAFGSRLDDKLKKATIKRLLPCIVEGQPIPRDLVDSVVRRASNFAGLSGYDWDRALTIACALYRKYKSGKENFDMSLDETRNTREYLFGRLLAIADVMEERTLSEAEKKRATNATRYMQQFSQRPFSTWKQIHELLTPYFMRQGDKASYYKWLIAQVEDLFTPEDFISNKPLTGEYLLGYYCQRQKMLEKKDKPDSEENETANSNE